MAASLTRAGTQNRISTFVSSWRTRARTERRLTIQLTTSAIFTKSMPKEKSVCDATEVKEAELNDRLSERCAIHSVGRQSSPWVKSLMIRLQNPPSPRAELSQKPRTTTRKDNLFNLRSKTQVKLQQKIIKSLENKWKKNRTEILR